MAGAEGPAAMLVWSRLVLCVIGRGYRAFLLTLLAVAMVPTLWSWSGYVVRSGSMEPAISVGDVVVAKPFSATEKVPLGRVVIFPDPSGSDRGELLVHRVVENLGGGEFATAGDANADSDVEPVTATDLQARAVILAPFVGRPLLWLDEGRVVPLLIWSLITVLAFVLAQRPGGRRGGPGRDGSAAPGAGLGGRRRRSDEKALVPALALVVAMGAAMSGTHTATATFTSTTASGSNTWAVARAVAQPYTTRVLANGPYAYYQLDESAGPTMADSSGHGRAGTYAAVSGFGRAGALPNNAGSSVDLDQSTSRLLSGGPALLDPDVYSLELWFRTTTTAGGKLIGFESTRNLASPTFDRHVVMRPDGRIVYGAWDANQVRTLVSPAAYNNGGWHHLVVTAQSRGQQQDSVMYVNGKVVASGVTTRTGYYSGWWRVGFGSLGSGSDLPASARFAGRIDQVAIYQSVLSPADVESHWASR